MAQNKGGRIAPTNQPAQAPGVGKNSKRHDLERRDVPFLHGSDLQQGDVQALEQGQRVAPVQTQRPATSGSGATPPAPQQNGSTGGRGMQVPDAVQFAKDKFGGSDIGVPSGNPESKVDISRWLPLVKRMANTPGASGNLRTAFINQYANLARRPYVPEVSLFDMNEMDASVEAMLNGR